MGLVPFQKRQRNQSFLSPLCEDTARRRHVQGRKRAAPEPAHAAPSAGFPGSRTVGNKCLLIKPPSLWTEIETTIFCLKHHNNLLAGLPISYHDTQDSERSFKNRKGMKTFL